MSAFTVFLPLETHVGERERTLTTVVLWRLLSRFSLLVLCRCKSQSHVGWKGQGAQANPERASPDGDPSHVRAAVHPEQQLQGQQDLPGFKAGEVGLLWISTDETLAPASFVF